MARVKAVYLTVRLRGTVETLFHRMFFDAKSYHAYVNAPEFKARWPEEEYLITKDIY